MTTREILVKELEQLKAAIDFNSKQELSCLANTQGPVIAVSSNEAKMEFCRRMGADYVLDYRDGDFAA